MEEYYHETDSSHYYQDPVLPSEKGGVASSQRGREMNLAEKGGRRAEGELAGERVVGSHTSSSSSSSRHGQEKGGTVVETRRRLSEYARKLYDLGEVDSAIEVWKSAVGDDEGSDDGSQDEEQAKRLNDLGEEEERDPAGWCRLFSGGATTATAHIDTV